MVCKPHKCLPQPNVRAGRQNRRNGSITLCQVDDLGKVLGRERVFPQSILTLPHAEKGGGLLDSVGQTLGDGLSTCVLLESDRKVAVLLLDEGNLWITR